MLVLANFKKSFTNKILFVEFKELLENFTFMEMDINGCKKRTARGWFEMRKKKSFIIKGSGYALKDVAVHYMMKENPGVFARLGRTWDEDENSYCHV